MDVITILRPEIQALRGKLNQSGSRMESRDSKPDRAHFASSKPVSSAAASAAFSVGAFSSIPSSIEEDEEKDEQNAKTFRREPLLSLFRGYLSNRKSSSAYAAASADAAIAAGLGEGFFDDVVFPSPAASRPAEDSFAGISSFPLLCGAIPLLVVLSAALCFLAPTFQSRFGLYFLEKKISLAPDGAAASAMNSNLNAAANSFGAGTAPISGGGRVFNIAQPVSYSSYTVRGGDTVSGIALRFGLDNIGTILAVNGIENARRIRSGQTLRIPSMDGMLYKAVAGDSLASIAAKFDIPLEALLDANDLDNSLVAIGQEIFIPGARLSAYELRKAMGELFVYPIRGRLTSRYGTRNDPFTGVKSFHTGVDLAAPLGTSVKASTDGRVAAAGWQNIYGNYVIVTHAGGYQTLYAHMSSISVQRGQYVTQGAEVGKVGSTGYSTGPHLHFSVYKDGKTINPFSVLD